MSSNFSYSWLLKYLRLLFLAAAASVIPGSYALASASSTTGATKSYDVVIIGGGSAGLTAAKVASTFGKSAVIVEQARMGGDCTWTGWYVGYLYISWLGFGCVG